MKRSWLAWIWMAPALLLLMGLWRLRFDVEVLNLLPDHLPVVAGLKQHQRYFGNAQELLVTLEARDAEVAASAAEGLAESLTQPGSNTETVQWCSPWREEPTLLADLIAYLWLNQPPAVFRRLLNRLGPAAVEAELEAALERLAVSVSPSEIGRLAYDPLGLTKLPGQSGFDLAGVGSREAMFASEDGKFRVVRLKPGREIADYRDSAAWLAEVRATVGGLRADGVIPDDVRIRYTGTPVFVEEAASGMERDLRISAVCTLLIIAVLFRLAHRRWAPLLWLTLFLLVILVGTLGLGGLFLGTLNVVSVGFAAILLGLAVDYALVLYQESRVASGSSARDIRRKVGRGILWSAITTACTFSLLNFGGLPGLGQLGSLIAMGVLLAAAVMAFLFLPLAVRGVRTVTGSGEADGGSAALRRTKCMDRAVAWLHSRRGDRLVLAVSGLLILVGSGWLVHAPPRIDETAEALSPSSSPAFEAMALMNERLGGGSDALWMLVDGETETEVGERLLAVESMERPRDLADWRFTLPTSLWPRPGFQRANRVALTPFLERRTELRRAVLGAGFSEEAFAMTERVMGCWGSFRASDNSMLVSPAVGWLFDQFSAKTPEGWLAFGLAEPPPTGFTAEAQAALEALPGVTLTGWPVLGKALLGEIEARLRWMLAGALAVLIGCLWLAYRSLVDLALGFATLGVAFLGLFALMSLAGWPFNLLNLMALPLLLGAGIDYSLHLQMALRRHDGDSVAVRSTTGRAVLLCAATSFVGFGSLAWSGNAGLASLGRLCAAGIAVTAFVSLALLPAWWRVAHPDQTSARPSALYRPGAWRLGLAAVRLVPRPVLDWLAVTAGEAYCRLQPRRRRIVEANLLPLLAEGVSAGATARRLFREFALKLADLWRYESGFAVDSWLTEWGGLEILDAAVARQRGVLLVTPHLGNWEFGAPFVAKRGLKLLVLTQSEPDGRLTRMRQNSRARWGIETVVVGEDAFAFVEVIRRLQEGAIVALLIDRPRPGTAVTVEFCGRPFPASVAAAELARASGCALLPVWVLRRAAGYAARVLPEIVYDRRALGNREARRLLTGEIMRRFEPVVRQHPEQWFHFVPVWPPEREAESVDRAAV